MSNFKLADIVHPATSSEAKTGESVAILESFRLRIEATKDASKRSRYAFGAITIVCVGFIISIWNAYWSWGYQFARDMTNPALSVVENSGTKLVELPEFESNRRKLVEAELSGWVSSQRIAVPLLGVSVSASDTPWLGGISLYVLTLWFFYCSRRENHVVASLLRDTGKLSNDADNDIKYMVFHGVSSQQVMTTVSQSDDAIGSLTFTPRPSSRWNSWPSHVLIYLPVITIVAILVSDVYSLFIVSVFRKGEGALWKVLEDPFVKWTYLAITYSISLAFLIMVCQLCANVAAFRKATQDIVREYYAEYVGNHRLTDNWTPSSKKGEQLEEGRT